jgi:hypothetical protein
MGLDFINRTDRTYEKSCDRGYRDLTRVRLFDPAVRVEERVFVARFIESFVIRPGAELVHRPVGDDIGVYQDERLVALGERPPRQILEKLQFAPQQLAVGRVQSFHPLSHAADISVH